jgi:hypothetical protein
MRGGLRLSVVNVSALLVYSLARMVRDELAVAWHRGRDVTLSRPVDASSMDVSSPLN